MVKPIKLQALFNFKNIILVTKNLQLSLLMVFSITYLAAQNPTNGSFTNFTGNSVTPASWINTLGYDPSTSFGVSPSVDVLDISFSSYSGISTVPCVPSPNGGSWVGLSDLPMFNENEAIQQTVSGFVIGQTYTISYYAANFGGAPFDDEGYVRIYFNGVQIASSPLLPLLANTWVPVSTTFIPPATSGVLQIDASTTSLPSGNGSYFSVDGLSITLSSPAPCNAGNTAPNLNQASTCISGNFNLTSLSASNTPAGTILGWYSGTPASVANAIGNSASVGSGTYYAAFYDEANNCFSPTSPLVLHPNPVAGFTNSEACLGLPSSFTDNSTVSTGTISQWSWDFGDGGSSTQQNPSNVYASQNSYSVSLTVTSDVGCIDSYTAISNVIASPIASFIYSPSEPTIYSPTVNFFNTSTAGSVAWDFGDGQTSSEAQPIHTYPSSQGIYTVTLIIGSGTCSDTASATLIVQDNLIYYVPNTFTPDGDKFNPTFKPVFTSGIDPYAYSLMIFDRWGELIFESRNPQIGWDGTYNNVRVQEGVYTWKIKFKLLDGDDRREIYGTVLSIR